MVLKRINSSDNLKSCENLSPSTLPWLVEASYLCMCLTISWKAEYKVSHVSQEGNFTLSICCWLYQGMKKVNITQVALYTQADLCPLLSPLAKQFLSKKPVGKKQGLPLPIQITLLKVVFWNFMFSCTNWAKETLPWGRYDWRIKSVEE